MTCSKRRCAIWATVGWGILLLVSALLLLTSHADSPLLVRQEAIEIALDVIVPATAPRPVTAYMTLDLLMPGDVVQPMDQPEHMKLIDRPTWFCWINDQPQEFFAHTTRYLFIDAETGDSQVFVENWWPELNGTDLFVTDADWLTTTSMIYSTVHVADP